MSLFIDNPEVMTGWLLGDGHITPMRVDKRGSHYSHNPGIDIRQTQEDFVNYIKSFICPNAKTHSYKNPHKGRENHKPIYFVTHQSKALIPYRLKWYPDNIKIAPLDIKITPIVLLLWFMGDGSTTRPTSQPDRIMLRLSTEKFTEPEVVFLRDSLSKLGINFNINKGRHTDKQRGFVLNTKKKSTVRDFLEYIGPCPVTSMEYKWKLPIFKL